MKQIIHSFLCGGTVWAACAVSQGVKAGGTSVSAAEDGEVVRPNICLCGMRRHQSLATLFW